MNRILKSVLVVSAVASLGALAAPASARSSDAFMGRSQNPADYGCFSESFGSLTNNCTATKLLLIPLVMDPGPFNNWLNATVNAYGATPSNNVGCGAYGIDKTTLSVWSPGLVYLSSFGSPQDIVPSGAYYPADGTAYVACYVSPGGRVNTVRY
jgi:hypothetical protein